MTSRDRHFGAILRQFQTSVFRHCLHMLGDREEAEEATQDVFMSIYRNLPGFREEATLTTWIYRITFNCCVSRRRRMKLPVTSLDDDGSHLDIADEEPGPDLMYTRQETRFELEKLIAALPEREAAAITLFYHEEQSYDEIAGIMKIPQGTVAALLHRGRAHLQSLAGRSAERKIHS
jgi:RNA polymerase sigma-70 factor, ECF subfamily